MCCRSSLEGAAPVAIGGGLKRRGSDFPKKRAIVKPGVQEKREDNNRQARDARADKRPDQSPAFAGCFMGAMPGICDLLEKVRHEDPTCGRARTTSGAPASNIVSSSAFGSNNCVTPAILWMKVSATRDRFGTMSLRSTSRMPVK